MIVVHYFLPPPGVPSVLLPQGGRFFHLTNKKAVGRIRRPLHLMKASELKLLYLADPCFVKINTCKIHIILDIRIKHVYNVITNRKGGT